MLTFALRSLNLSHLSAPQLVSTSCLSVARCGISGHVIRTVPKKGRDEEVTGKEEALRQTLRADGQKHRGSPRSGLRSVVRAPVQGPGAAQVTCPPGPRVSCGDRDRRVRPSAVRGGGRFGVLTPPTNMLNNLLFLSRPHSA